ncbi:hypothetical protein PSACC_00179 [Paramicrosporidium saccamoebae]|uniref:Uncharacterized protein n=1 Tax=Paramicrosporidium saccamoebae TaxID=1246581 RepID=A0A2H9TQG3_9FUNG|nr:hypothetical protein PSACC_00179 [Paramicrosporidium saccamoebae]
MRAGPGLPHLYMLSVTLLTLAMAVEAKFHENVEFHTVSGGLAAVHFKFKQTLDVNALDLTRKFGGIAHIAVGEYGEMDKADLYALWTILCISQFDQGAEYNFPKATPIFPVQEQRVVVLWTLAGPATRHTSRRSSMHGKLDSVEQASTLCQLGWDRHAFKSTKSVRFIFSSIRHPCANCTEKKIELVQNLVVVFDLARHGQTLDWSLRKLMGRTIESKCPATESSVLSILQPNGCPNFKLAESKNDDSVIIDLDGYTFDPDQILKSNLMVSENAMTCSSMTPSSLLVDRYLSGIGQDRGGLVVSWKNPTTTDIEISHAESLPFYMKLFLSQMEFTLGDQMHGPSYPRQIIYAPEVARQSPSQLELKVVIPAGQSVTMKIPFERDLLRYTDYPFDANRGFDIAGAIIQFADETIVTPTLLLTMPVPDFTMPYNFGPLTRNNAVSTVSAGEQSLAVTREFPSTFEGAPIRATFFLCDNLLTAAVSNGYFVLVRQGDIVEYAEEFAADQKMEVQSDDVLYLAVAANVMEQLDIRAQVRAHIQGLACTMEVVTVSITN